MAVFDGEAAFPAVSAENAPFVSVFFGKTAAPAINMESAPFVSVFLGEQVRVTYHEGFSDGELDGFLSPREHVMEPILLDEMDDDRKAISFHIYTATGLAASGLTGQGIVCLPAVGEIQTNRDLAGYVNSTGTFSHVGDGFYRYTFSNAEVAAGSDGNIWLRVKVPGFRTVVARTPIRAPFSANEARDALFDAARSGFIGSGTLGEGVAVAVAMLQGNFYMDQVADTPYGEILSRIRCFHAGAAAAAATNGGSGEGEFAAFVVTTTYAGHGRIATHRVVKQ